MTKTGKRNSRAAKLTPIAVYELRCDWDSKLYTQAQLADKYNIGIGQVGRIVRGEAWKQFSNPGQIERDIAAAQERYARTGGQPTGQAPAEVEAKFTNVFEKMSADIAKAREKPLDNFLDETTAERAKGYLGDKR